MKGMMLSYLRKITLHFHHLHFSPIAFPFIFYYRAQSSLLAFSSCK
ncbi:Uncharacterized protein NEOC65_000303 [Neochlamydia sp. AcF65]|nr:Uncharacterized protein [Neochlamydia sp. AcF65]